MSRIISCSHPLFPAGGKRRRCNAPTPRPPVSEDTEVGKGVSAALLLQQARRFRSSCRGTAVSAGA